MFFFTNFICDELLFYCECKCKHNTDYDNILIGYMKIINEKIFYRIVGTSMDNPFIDCNYFYYIKSDNSFSFITITRNNSYKYY